jgi:hypothetical protein
VRSPRDQPFVIVYRLEGGAQIAAHYITSLAVTDMSGYWVEDQIEAYRLNAQIVLEFLKSLFSVSDDDDFNVHVRYYRETKLFPG